LDRCLELEPAVEQIEVHAYEIDAPLYDTLKRRLKGYQRPGLALELRNEEFLEAVTRGGLLKPTGFTHALLNPPYKKIGAGSGHRRAASSVGLEVVNLYAAFVGLALAMLEPGGQLVAIIPRSFCNGPYYKPFRRWLFEHGVLRRLHLFDSRTQPFAADAVLQETVILHMERGRAPSEVCISLSADATFEDLRSASYPVEAIWSADDPELLIHIPSGEAPVEHEQSINATLDELGIKVSTGPVVDFRLREFLLDEPSEQGCAALLYPLHMSGHGIQWPILGAKKPNAIAIREGSRRWLYQRGNYCVVRRFSSKEEPRRLVASVVTQTLHGGELIGFENHLNVFHAGKRGLTLELAYGLTAYLTTSRVEQRFRQFNGHTQVNVSDLKALRYPQLATLEALGRWAMTQAALSVEACDAALESLT
jgi:hypothetical protein